MGQNLTVDMYLVEQEVLRSRIYREVVSGRYLYKTTIKYTRRRGQHEDDLKT